MATEPTTETPTPQANFVFQGTIQRLNAATMSQVPVSNRTVVVRVDRLILAPDTLTDYAGQEITVQLAAGDDVAVGQTFIFSTHGWIFGDGLAVQAVKLEQATTSAIAAMSAHPDDHVRSLHLREARKQADGAELIVSGRVSAVRVPARESQARISAMATGRTAERISEHAPMWQEAVVDVEAVHKGRHDERKQVVIRFPTSTDVRWREAPKFHAGQEGVFLLHKAQLQAMPTAMAATTLEDDEYTALNAEDFQSLDDLSHLT
jgi:hypothetical protein